MVNNMETISSFPWVREKWKIRSAEGAIVAISQPWDVSGCRQEDNANINAMTASPNLYQELKYAVECIETGLVPNDKWLDRAKLAISMAEGINT